MLCGLHPLRSHPLLGRENFCLPTGEESFAALSIREHVRSHRPPVPPPIAEGSRHSALLAAPKGITCEQAAITGRIPGLTAVETFGLRDRKQYSKQRCPNVGLACFSRPD